jgi:hypothetical protein
MYLQAYGGGSKKPHAKPNTLAVRIARIANTPTALLHGLKIGGQARDCIMIGVNIAGQCLVTTQTRTHVVATRCLPRDLVWLEPILKDQDRFVVRLGGQFSHELINRQLVACAPKLLQRGRAKIKAGYSQSWNCRPIIHQSRDWWRTTASNIVE